MTRAKAKPTAAKIYRQGKPRPGGQRPWRVTAYSPDATFPYGRVRFKLDSGAWTQRTPGADETLDELFENIERSLDARVTLAVKGEARRDINALCDRYEQWMVDTNKQDTTMTTRTNIMSKWIRPIIGEVLVADWAPEHTRKVLNAVKHLSPERVSDVGTVMSGLRNRAHEKVNGRRWLALTENPMEGVSFTIRGGVSGQHSSYVEPSARPTDKMVAAAIEAAKIRADIIKAPGLVLLVILAAGCGLRLGENCGLRDFDVDLSNMVLKITGAWTWPRGQYEKDEHGKVVIDEATGKPKTKKPYRKSTKTNLDRTVPYPASAHLTLIERIAALRQTGAWGWLTCDDRTGQPWNKETLNDEWHRIVALTAKLAAEHPDRYEAWPAARVTTRKHASKAAVGGRETVKVAIPMRNLRHYRAVKWHSRGLDWPEVAKLLGNSHQTVLKHYVRPGADTDDRARELMNDE